MGPWLLWLVHSSRRWAGIVLYAPDGNNLSLPFKLKFPYSNNEVEYEALITRFISALQMEFPGVGARRFPTHYQISQRRIRDKRNHYRIFPNCCPEFQALYPSVVEYIVQNATHNLKYPSSISNFSQVHNNICPQDC